MNTTHYDSSVYGPSKVTRIHCEGEDYHKAKTLSHWLFVKYDMSYKTFRNKSKSRRDELKMEFEADTGVLHKTTNIICLPRQYLAIFSKTLILLGLQGYGF